MDPIEKDIQNRTEEIREGVDHLFKMNMKITDWDVPEADNKKAANMIINIMQEMLNTIKADAAAGKYDYY